MRVSILMVRALVGAIERSGANRKQFFAAAALEPQLIEDRGAWLSICDYLRAIDAALAVSGNPALGMHMGEHASASMFDVIGSLSQHAPTLRDGCEAMMRYSRLMSEGYAPHLHEHESSASIRFDGLCGDHPAVRLTAEFSMTSLVSELRRYAGHDARPTRAAFAYPAPAYVAEYERMFGDRAHFDQPHTELTFPSAWLDTPQLYQSPDVHALLKGQAERALDRLERSASFTARVEILLASHAPRPLTMDAAARELGSSRRSLNRRLAAEGTTYGALVERARIHNAKRMLESAQTTIQETAFAMGFADPAAFHRAFKRWTGMTPKQYQDSF